jgi:hypothetical protein
MQTFGHFRNNTLERYRLLHEHMMEFTENETENSIQLSDEDVSVVTEKIFLKMKVNSNHFNRLCLNIWMIS